MRLSALLPPGFPLPASEPDVEVSALTADSRQVTAGSLFAALAGSRADGGRFVPDAIARGAVAILCSKDTGITPPPGIALISVDDPRRMLAMLAARFYAEQPRTVVAVTGTNGKTSVAEFTRQIFASLGRKAASLGTIGLVKPDGGVYGSLTTPDPVALHSTMAGLAAEGVTHLALEASSHGLDQRRLDGVRLAAAAFTTFGRDHLDYHPSVEAYLAAKLRLFEVLVPPGGAIVVNADGVEAERFLAAARERGLNTITIGRKGQTLRLVDVERRDFRQRLTIAAGEATHHIDLNLIGSYQAENALVAAGLALATGEEADDVLAAIGTIKGVSGRLEVAGTVRGGLVVIDYAHKPEALEAALTAVRPFATGRLISVFGCGGDRDRGKRPIMGDISTRLADITIVTDDNPRTEPAATIRAEILAAAPGAREIADRAEAIREAVGMIAAGDVVVVAGKGHETGQIVGDTVIPFSDQQVVAEALREIERHE